jgi:hypothetical protein
MLTIMQTNSSSFIYQCLDAIKIRIRPCELPPLHGASISRHIHSHRTIEVHLLAIHPAVENALCTIRKHEEI